MVRKGIYPLTSIVFLLLIIIAGIHTYKNLALWLFLSDPLPGRLDYICTFAGSPEREPYSLQLMNKFTNAFWVVSTERKHFKKWASERGIDSSRIVVTQHCNSTLEEITCFRDIITIMENGISGEAGKKSTPLIGFVSSPYHMRRISVLFALSRNKIFKKGFFLPAPIEKPTYSKSNLRFWWKNAHIKRIVKQETTKLVGSIVITIPLFGSFIKIWIRE